MVEGEILPSIYFSGSQVLEGRQEVLIASVNGEKWPIDGDMRWFIKFVAISRR